MRGDAIEKILRAAYSATLYLLAPVTLYHLIWRGFRHREYFQRWNERYAAYSERPDATMVWLHAVSVGEVNAAAPLVDALRRARPDLKLVVTTITPTGSARAKALWLDAVEHVYLPYDLPGAVNRFLDHFAPRIALILETELWPNLLFGCRDRGIPTYVLNARLSERSLRGYRVLAPLIGRALRGVTGVAAQSAADGERFIALGAPRERVSVTGNLKYDIAVPANAAAFVAEFQAGLGAPRPTWIAASTHDGEEGAVLAAHRCLRKRWPELLLLWAPRHPERFRPVSELVRSEGLRAGTRSRERWPQADDAVFVIDTLGELADFYACADVAFVGGSLQPIGGHNLLEPAALGKAVVTGPHLHNFAEIAANLERAGALRIVPGAEALCPALEALLADPDARARMGNAGLDLVAQGRGALVRTMALIEPRLPAGLP